jgi:hypothetical protein
VEGCVEDEDEGEAHNHEDMFVVDLVEPTALESKGGDISAISACHEVESGDDTIIPEVLPAGQG